MCGLDVFFLEYYPIFDSRSWKFLGSSELASWKSCHSPIVVFIELEHNAKFGFPRLLSLKCYWEVVRSLGFQVSGIKDSVSSFSLSLTYSYFIPLPTTTFLLDHPTIATSFNQLFHTTTALPPWGISSSFLQPATQQLPFLPEHLLYNNPPTPLYQSTTQHFSSLSYSPRLIFFPFLRTQYPNNITNFQ